MQHDDTSATRVRAASPSDTQALARLRTRVHGVHVDRAPEIFTRPAHTEMEEEFRALLGQGHTRAFIALAGEVPVGYVLALVQERPATPLVRARRWLYVDQISVEPAWTRRGVGRQLMQATIDLARSLQIDDLVTDVWAFNEETQAFARACGFRSQMERFSMRLGE